MTDLLFVYGTLDPDRAPAEIAATARRLTRLGEATIRGQLLDLGEYPGVLLDEAGIVRGQLFALPDGAGEPAETWARLDAYEDYRADDPAASLFVRQRTVAILPDASQVGCWVYAWNPGRGN